MALVFSREDHSYALDGLKLESVTKILEAVLKVKSSWWKPSHRVRGHMVHAICEAIDLGDWDPDNTVVPDGFDRDEIINRGLAYQRWMEMAGFEPVPLPSKVLYSEALGIAGTLDTYGAFHKGQLAGMHGVVDLKSGPPSAAAPLQVALYSHMLAGRYRTDATVIVHLQASGKPKATCRCGNDLRADEADALAVVRTFWFMKNHGLL